MNFRYGSLDHWRGVACLWVMVFHSFVPMGLGKLHPAVGWFQGFSSVGWFGVHLFFVISGYCVAVKAFQMASRRQPASQFLADRCFRIYPTYWAVCVFAILLALVFSPFSHGDLSESLPRGWSGALANVLLVEPYFGFPPLIVVSWSLVYEVGFYVLITVGMLMHAISGRWRWGLVLGGAGAVAGIAGIGQWNLLRVLTYWPDFFCGICVFLFVLAKQRGTQREWWWMLVPAALAFAPFVIGSDSVNATLAGAAIFSILLMILHRFDAVIAAFRPLDWLAWCGGISYSLYLVHVPVGSRLMNGGLRFIKSTDWQVVFLPLLYWGGSILAAPIFFHLVESRFETLRSRVFRRKT